MTTRHPSAGPTRSRRRERGGVLAEFALVSFVVWLLLAGVLELGRAFSAQQILQHATRTIARELALVELAHDASFEQALPGVFDPRFLVIDSDLLARCGFADFGEAGHEADLERLFSERLPLGNRLIRPLMIRDRIGGLEMLRYPGALLARTDGGVTATSDCGDGSLYTIGIPRLDEAAGRVAWLPVVEQTPGPDPVGARREGFALRDGGWVGLRLFYPFQSAALLGVRDSGIVDPETGRMLQTFDAAGGGYVDEGLDRLGARLLSELETDGGLGAAGGVSAYAGMRGLGRISSISDASGGSTAVRPYRRLLTATAGFRREIFLPTGGAS